MRKTVRFVLIPLMILLIALISGCGTVTEDWAYIHEPETTVLSLSDNGKAIYKGEKYNYTKDDTFLTLTRSGEELKLRYVMDGDKMILYEKSVYNYDGEGTPNGIVGVWKQDNGWIYEFTSEGSFSEESIFFGHYSVDENNGTIKNVDFQIDQMTQKVQYLEKSDLVEGYAWFIGNSNARNYPYMSLQQTNSASSELSELGKVYVYMSAFDTEKFYTPGEIIAAKDYVDATLDGQQVKLRSNTDAASEQVLQVEFAPSASATYQVEVPFDDTYTLSLRMKSDVDNAVRVYCDGINSAKLYYDGTLPSTSGAWKEQTIEFKKSLTAGRHTIMLYSMSLNSFFVNQMELTTTTGISTPTLQATQEADNKYYSLSGVATTKPQKGIYIHNGKKIIHQ